MPSDPNQAAALTVKLATEEQAKVMPEMSVISQYLATIGRRGGIKGGKARAKKLTPKQRSAIARVAANSRWADKGK
jgi:hypothetical protein